MELDDLRRQWQQPETASPPVSPAQLESLLKQRSTGLIEKMRRNAWFETVFTALVALALPFYIGASSSAFHRMYGAAMLLLAVLMLYYFYRQLRLLGRMAQAEVHVRAHLTALSAGLRQLLSFYYRLTLATGPLSLLLVLGFYLGKELARPGPFRWQLIGGVAAAFLVLGALLQVAVVYGTRWYLQRLYGQHLDRLEANLRELSDEPVV
jgi:hypothetical protein